MSPNAALARVELTPRVPASVTVTSDLLGVVVPSTESTFTFPVGMFGFPECRQFALLAAGRDGLFWLQSMEHTALTFLLADPFLFFDGYAVDLGAGDRTELQLHDDANADDVAVLVIVTLPRTRDELPTANLQGPLAVNFASRVGRQLAVADGAWGVRCPLDLSAPRASS